MAKTFDKVKRLIAGQLYIPDDDITALSGWKELGADSLDVVEVVIAVEEEYDIRVGNEAIDKLKTVGDLVALIDKLKGIK